MTHFHIGIEWTCKSTGQPLRRLVENKQRKPYTYKTAKGAQNRADKLNVPHFKTVRGIMGGIKVENNYQVLACDSEHGNVTIRTNSGQVKQVKSYVSKDATYHRAG